MTHPGSEAASEKLRNCRRLRAYFFILLGVASLFSISTLRASRLIQAGWQEETRLTSDTSTSFTAPNNSKWLAVDLDGNLHAVWLDNRDRNFEIYHKMRSGGVWSADERVTFDPGYSARPNLAVDESGFVHLVWNDDRDGNWEIYYRAWTGSWQKETRVTETTGDSFGACLAAEGDTIHMVYMENVDGLLQVMYRRLKNNQWSQALPLTNVSTGNRMVPTIDIGPDRSLHVAWWDTREDASGVKGKIYYREKSGDIWLDEVLLTDPANEAMRANIAVDDSGYVHVVWIDQRTTYDQIYYRRRGPSGWENEIALTNEQATHYHPSVDAADGEVIVAYWDNHLSELNSEIFFQRRVAGSWIGPLRISNGADKSELPCLIAEKNRNLHLAWVDSRDGNQEIYYREYIDPQNGVGGGDEQPPEAAPPLSMTAYPNPFRGSTSIELSVPFDCRASINLYGADGRRVRNLFTKRLPRGKSAFAWDARDDAGRDLPPGVYFAVGRAGKSRIQSKIVLLR